MGGGLTRHIFTCKGKYEVKLEFPERWEVKIKKKKTYVGRWELCIFSGTTSYS